MPYTPSRDTTARIRILACEPQPVPRTASRWPVFVAAAVVGAVGVVGTLLLTPQQPPAQVLSPVIESPAVELAGGVNVASFRHTPAVNRSLRAAVVGADLQQAAKQAARDRAVPQPFTVTSPTASSGVTAGPLTAVQAQPSQQRQSAPPPASQRPAAPRINPAPAVKQPTTPIGPEAPDNVSDPTTPN